MKTISKSDSDQLRQEQLLMLVYLAQGEESYRTKPPIPHSEIKRLFAKRHAERKNNS